jgi:WD repeat-containing protein 19
MLGECSHGLHKSQELVGQNIEQHDRNIDTMCVSCRSKVSDILPHVHGPKIHSMYAKARESEGRFKEACAAYIKAGEWENAIRYGAYRSIINDAFVLRIQLNQLKSPEQAVKIVRETNSIEGAKMVARFFESINEYDSAVQFLVLSKCYAEAFAMAQQKGLMERYLQAIGKRHDVERAHRDITISI